MDFLRIVNYALLQSVTHPAHGLPSEFQCLSMTHSHIPILHRVLHMVKIDVPSVENPELESMVFSLRPGSGPNIHVCCAYCREFCLSNFCFSTSLLFIFSQVSGTCGITGLSDFYLWLDGLFYPDKTFTANWALSVRKSAICSVEAMLTQPGSTI